MLTLFHCFCCIARRIIFVILNIKIEKAAAGQFFLSKLNHFYKPISISRERYQASSAIDSGEKMFVLHVRRFSQLVSIRQAGLGLRLPDQPFKTVNQ
jgi:hypothetical protein